MEWTFFSKQNKNIQIGLFRQWMGRQKNKPFLWDKKPIWVHLIRLQFFWCVDEIFSYPIEKNLLNWRDETNRGFLHYCIYNQSPENTIKQAIPLLDETWNNPDKSGNTAMDICNHPEVAQLMAWKWWSQNFDVVENNRMFNNLAQSSSDEGMESVARVWRFWARPHTEIINPQS